jgi:hypothetical protein
MALLQAARAYVLGLPIDSAYSWGLNRAIFYAAAKRGFKGGGSAAGHGPKHGAPSGAEEPRAPTQAYHLGDELAFTAQGTKELLFAIGGKTQTSEDFERQVAARFNGKFREAWDEALDYVRHFDRETLLSGSEFFSSVYRPKRDEFAAKWTEMAEGGQKTRPMERHVAAPRDRSKRQVRAS